MLALQLSPENITPLRISHKQASTTPEAGREPLVRATEPGARCLSSFSTGNTQISPPGLGPVARSASAKAIRPLPPIPIAVLPQLAPQCCGRQLRPLPSPPSNTPKKGTPVSVACHEPSPCPALDPPSAHPESLQHRPRTRPVRPPLPLVLTNPDALDPSSDERLLRGLSPLEPTPVPTPLTAERKRVSEFCRRLGERIPDKEVYTHVVPANADTKTKASKCSLKFPICLKAKILDLGSDDESSGESNEEHEEDREAYTWVMEEGRLYHTTHKQRYTRQWIWEKGGYRRKESDYNAILQALRAL